MTAPARDHAYVLPPMVVEFEREAPRTWFADVVDLPGVMAYGTSKADAFRKVQALALEVVADRLKHGEDPMTGRPARQCAPRGRKQP